MNSRRNTVQKQLILSAVGELDVHATAEQVYEHVALAHPTISKATVYRNLRQMAESGELIDIGSFHGSTHYDHRCHEHSHFVCDSCKQVFDVEGDFSDMIDRAEKTHGVTINSYQLSFSGICQKCESLQTEQL
jgi:Fe2+ or Zn2+ uptake regulation protein